MALAICIWEVLSRRFLIEKIFSLILVFVYLAYALLLAGLEFLSLVILLLYVGAIAVLFLFVIMILNPDYHLLLEELKNFQYPVDHKDKPVEEEDSFLFHTFLPCILGGLMSYVIFFTTVIRPMFRNPPSTPEFLPDGSPAPLVYVVYESKKYAPWHIHKENMTLVELGDILYTMYGIGVFIIAACLLLAMMSSILLCVHRTLKLKRQNISKQSKRYK
jgi:NADH:ubiquinone oxidoreductase subunit 6 (subunit J)